MFDLVKDLFDYKDGHLVYKKQTGSRGKVGAIAGSENPTDGRWYVKINGNKYGAHRIIFLWHNGYLPKEVDHKDRDIKNNRIENLREADRFLNNQNKGVYKNNLLGVKGVRFRKDTGKWVARIQQNLSRTSRDFDDLYSANNWVINMRNKLHNGSEGVVASKGV